MDLAVWKHAVDSVTKLNRYLTQRNLKLPGHLRKGTDVIVEKFLACIREPSALATEAEKLLRSDKANLPDTLYDQPVVGLPAVPGGWKRAEVVALHGDVATRSSSSRSQLRARSVRAPLLVPMA